MQFSSKLETKKAPSWPVQIFIAGDLNTIKKICRDYCMEKGLCVTVNETTFIYTGGEESGAIIGLINYPRFPATQESITDTAIHLGSRIMLQANQKSFSVQTPEKTIYFSRQRLSDLTKNDPQQKDKQ